MAFEQVLFDLERLGLTDVLLPFFLIFTITFAVLSKMKFLTEKKEIHIVLAMVIALTTVIPHVTGGYPPGYDVVEIINFSLPSVALLLIAGFCVLVVLGVFGVDIANKGSPFIGYISLALLVYIFGNAIGWWYDLFDIFDILGSGTILTLVFVIAFFWLLFLVTGPSDNKKGNPFLDTLGTLFEKK